MISALYTLANLTRQDAIAEINAVNHLTGVPTRWDADDVELDRDNHGSSVIIAYNETTDVLNHGSSTVQQV